MVILIGQCNIQLPFEKIIVKEAAVSKRHKYSFRIISAALRVPNWIILKRFVWNGIRVVAAVWDSDLRIQNHYSLILHLAGVICPFFRDGHLIRVDST